jgi:hypothetical protein
MLQGAFCRRAKASTRPSGLIFGKRLFFRDFAGRPLRARNLQRLDQRKIQRSFSMSISSVGALSMFSPAASARLSAPAATDPADPSAKARGEFLDYVKMTPAQRMRADILGRKGLTEEQLKSMDPKERAKIEEEIRAEIKQAMEGKPTKPGQIADVTA